MVPQGDPYECGNSDRWPTGEILNYLAERL
jgi:hypothetical protein